MFIVKYMAQKIVACLILSFFALTIFTGISVDSANATKIAMEWGHLNYNLYVNNQTRFNNERAWETTICANVNSMFAGRGWSSSNSYGNPTTPINVYNVLNNVANPSNGVTTAATFWVGDYYPSMSALPTPYGQLGCYTSVNGSYVWDHEIYSRTTANGARASKQHFTLMWTCANGGLYWRSAQGGYNVIMGITFPIVQSTKPTGTPNTNTNTFYGHSVSSTNSIVGMPYAWTGTTGMSLNGYSSPSGSYTYIGWECNSPFMIDTPPAGASSTNLQYLYFVYNFYNYALGYVTGSHETVNNSLNYAAETTFGVRTGNTYYNFGTSVLNTGQWLNKS